MMALIKFCLCYVFKKKHALLTDLWAGQPKPLTLGIFIKAGIQGTTFFLHLKRRIPELLTFKESKRGKTLTKYGCLTFLKVNLG